ncbi:MAG: ABC transporter permease subunit [Phycisphaerae bacterium]
MNRSWPAVGLLWLALLAPATARGDALNDLRERGTLVWGGDAEGGGPYIFTDPHDAERLTGFEVDLATVLADALGVRAKFFQADWNTLPEFLASGRIDIILNGYEWTPGRAARMAATRPYYIYELQLLTRADDARIRALADLRVAPPAGGRWSVSVLGGTSAANYLRDRFGETVALAEYNGNTDAMAQVRAGVHDATLADLPVAIFYRDQPQGRGLRFAGPPVEPGYYVIFARRDAGALVAAINAALDAALRDGRLRALYERYSLWTPAQERLASATVDAAARAPLAGWGVVRRYAPILLRAAAVTVEVSLLAMPLAITLGLFVALGRMYGPGWLRLPLTAAVEVLRGTPVMLQLYVIYFLLPTLLPISFSPIVAAVLGLGINYSAYESEIYRAGMQAIPAGQMEAALALGLPRRTAIWRIIVPQAVRIVIPPVTNDFVALFKDTSVCSVIAVTELTKQYNMAANGTGAILELAGMTAVLYLAMSYPLSLAARRLEASLGLARPGT